LSKQVKLINEYTTASVVFFYIGVE